MFDYPQVVFFFFYIIPQFPTLQSASNASPISTVHTVKSIPSTAYCLCVKSKGNHFLYLASLLFIPTSRQVAFFTTYYTRPTSSSSACCPRPPRSFLLRCFLASQRPASCIAWSYSVPGVSPFEQKPCLPIYQLLCPIWQHLQTLWESSPPHHPDWWRRQATLTSISSSRGHHT